MGGTKLSVASKYGIATAVIFLIQTTFSAAKMCSTTSADLVALPWNTVSYSAVGLLYVGFFLLAGCEEIKNGWLYYTGGMGFYTLAYVFYGVSFGLQWAQVATTLSTHLSLCGGILFTVATLVLMYKAAPPWGDKTYSPLHTFEDFFFGPPCVWWGCVAFLIGSFCFLVSGIYSELGVTVVSTAFSQAGILLFIPGRVMFLASSMQSIQTGREFRYGSNSKHIVDVSAGITLGARLFAAMRQTREANRPCLSAQPSAMNKACKRTEEVTKSKSSPKTEKSQKGDKAEEKQEKEAPVSLPGGSWWRKAQKDDQGRYGHIEMQNGMPVLHAKLRKNDGSYADASTPFKELETFTAVDGEFMTGCAVGLTTREIVFLCDLYDELDVQGIGYLTADELLAFAHSIGLRHVEKEEIEKMIEDMDLDAGTHTDDAMGLTYPEFLMMVTKNLEKGYTYSNEMEKCWEHLQQGSNDGCVHKEQLRRFVDEAQLEMDDNSLEDFLQEYGHDGKLSKSELYAIFGHPRSDDNDDCEDEESNSGSDVEQGLRSGSGGRRSRGNSYSRQSGRHSNEDLNAGLAKYRVPLLEDSSGDNVVGALQDVHGDRQSEEDRE